MNKLFIYGLASILAIAALVAIMVATGPDDTSTPSKTDPKKAEAVHGPAPEKQMEPETQSLTPPSFDVVRVNPRGDAVIAGRAHPGSLVLIKDGEQVLGQIEADDRGEWVFLPDEPLKPGTRQLSLEMRLDGHDPVMSETVVVLSVPEPGKTLDGKPAGTGSGVLAVEMRRDGKGVSRVLQEPKTDTIDMAIAIKTVDYDDIGRLIVSGQTGAGGLVQLYLNDTFLGRTNADDKGVWLVTPEHDIEPGVYDLRADLIDDEGRVLARASTPFRKDPQMPDMESGTFVIVQPGSSLWRIARKSYGSGFAFTVIFQANQGQIKDPDLIYPGQVFTLPTK